MCFENTLKQSFQQDSIFQQLQFFIEFTEFMN